LKIVTYNLRFGGAGRNHWSKVLEELDPDIFLTQESYPPSQHLWPLLDGPLHTHASWSPILGVFTIIVLIRPFAQSPLPTNEPAKWIK
jgi:hypothetical protein